jgi:hypothetical protein
MILVFRKAQLVLTSRERDPGTKEAYRYEEVEVVMSTTYELREKSLPPPSCSPPLSSLLKHPRLLTPKNQTLKRPARSSCFLDLSALAIHIIQPSTFIPAISP